MLSFEAAGSIKFCGQRTGLTADGTVTQKYYIHTRLKSQKKSLKFQKTEYSCLSDRGCPAFLTQCCRYMYRRRTFVLKLPTRVVCPAFGHFSQS